MPPKLSQAAKTSRCVSHFLNRCRSAPHSFFLLTWIFALACAGAFAQANSVLTGIVTDQSGAVVAGAKIVLTDPATGLTKTTESGRPVCMTSAA